MALTSMGYWLTVDLVDGGGDKTRKTYQLTAADAASAATDVAAVIAALQAVTGAVIKTYQYGLRYGEDSLVYPAATVQVENKAAITVQLDAVGAKRAVHTIPAPVIGIFKTATGQGANEVDIADGDLITYMTLFATGNECYISDGETMDLLVSGKRIHAHSNNG